MPTVTISEDLHSAIESRLRHQFASRAAAAASYGAEYATLWRVAGDRVLGGKLLRPRLMLEMYRALVEGVRAESDLPIATAVLDLAAAVETLHYSFLLHDDVIDGDTRRRRSPNLIAALRDGHPDAVRHPRQALHWGQAGGILMGDLLLADVHQVFARVEIAQPIRTRALDLLDHTIAETVAGEQSDVALSDRVVAPDLNTILAMTAHKTATYTFEFPLRLAAVLAGASLDIESALTAIGRHLGLAFQLQDDLLSVFGEPSVAGKDPYSDLREGKQTALIAYARMTSAWPAIEPGFGAPGLSEAEAESIKEGLRACGAEAFVRSLIGEQMSTAYALIAESDAAGALPAGARRVLVALAERLEGRQS